MEQKAEGVFVSAVAGYKEGMELMKALTDVGQPGAVYGDPVSVGEHTVITASEVTVGLGFSYGGGGAAPPSEPAVEGGKAGEKAGAPGGYGAGGAAGGGAGARPVAVIHISNDGVRVEPVVDVTKLALAFLTTLGSIFVMGARLRQARRTAKTRM